MFKVLNADQRPRIKGKLFEMFSYLPYYNGYVKPFGDLMGIEEIQVSPGGELFPDNEEMEFLFLGREGRLEISREESEAGILEKNSCLASHPPAGEVVFRNSCNHAVSRLISLSFRPGSEPVPPGSSEYKAFAVKGNRTVLVTLAAAGGAEDALPLSLDAVISLARIGKGEKLIFKTRPSRRILMVLLEGSMDAEKNRLNKNDCLMVMGEPLVNLNAFARSKVLIVDLPEYTSPTEMREAAGKEEPARDSGGTLKRDQANSCPQSRTNTVLRGRR